MLRRYLTIIALFGLLTACGGGGSGASGPIVSTLTFQFKTAWGAYQQQNTIFPITLSGTATNASLGGFQISGSGTVTQTTGTANRPALDGVSAPVTVIVVTRVYDFTALVNGYSITQRLTDVAYYDPTSYAYMGGTFTDGTLTTTNNVVLAGWVLPPDTLQCCSSDNSFYETSTMANGVPTHNIWLSVLADTANSVFVNLADIAPAGASRRYRLDNTNTLTPVTENINVIAYVVTTGGTYPFNAAVTFNY